MELIAPSSGSKYKSGKQNLQFVLTSTSILKLAEVLFLKTSVKFYQAIWRNIQEEGPNLQFVGAFRDSV